jgi:hypothetical protein
MPIFYNSAAPTPTTKNNINDIAVTFGIRDFLLNKNLLPVYPQLSTSQNGSPRIGEPVLDTLLNNGSNSTNVFGLPLETEGILHMQIAVLPNQFRNMDSTANDLTDIQYVQPSQSPYPNSEFPSGNQSYPTSSNQDTFNYGIMGKTQESNFRKVTLKNLYLDVDKQIDMGDFISQNTIPNAHQIKGYLDVYGGLNLGGSSDIQNLNVIGSVLDGQGLGIAKSGVVPNFDLRASLAGRILGATGTINDTKLGMIGGQQLALALANNAAFNLQQSLLGALNVQDNVLSLIKGGGLTGFRPNYQITVASSVLGKVVDYTARILGFTLPKSYLEDSGSIFLSESNTGNIERANAMILHTGKGQVQALITNMNASLIGTSQFDNPTTTPFRSGYAPGFKDNKGDKAINSNIYAFGDADGIIKNFLTNNGVIPEINYKRSSMILQYGFEGPEDVIGLGNPYVNSTIKKKTFNWGSDVGGTVNSENSPSGNINPIFASAVKKKSLLSKTQTLFDDIGMKNIVSGFGDIDSSIIPSQIQTAVVGGGISKGSAVMGGGRFDESGHYTGQLTTPFNTYARSWGSNLRYTNVSNLIRNSGLTENVPYRSEMHGSVLDTNGFVKISPYSTDKPEDPKKFMFSIENLAWSDRPDMLLSEEKGPGDLMSSKSGRIMWFPPYDINFTESSSVSWESNNFIGRGEPVYTYNNTERSGNLSFKIVVDHPTYVNSFRGNNGPDDHYIASFFAGAVLPTTKFANKLTVSEISSLSSNNTVTQVKSVTAPAMPPDFSVYFPYNDIEVPVTPVHPAPYEDGLCSGLPIDYTTNPTGAGCPTDTLYYFNYGLNGGLNVMGYGQTLTFDNQSFSGWSDTTLISGLYSYLTKDDVNDNLQIYVKGYAGTRELPGDLSLERANNMISYLRSMLPKGITYTPQDGGRIDDIDCEKNWPDSTACKKLRKVDVSFVYTPATNPAYNAEPVVPSESKTLNTQITNRFYTESNYFDKLKETDDFVFDKFRDKIKYFHPAFHSTTPEGLNSRLTFLLQCTRQGPTLETQDANNLAFGRAPICILRIGDFYNTKIIIDSIGFEFEPLVWDLNPEGIGVQPMIANINMSFKFIGGSTLMGPINKLQNALSFNYFANSQVYDVRADYIAKVSDIPPTLVGKTSGLNKTISPNGDYTIGNHYIDENMRKNNVFGATNESTQQQIIAQTPVIDQTKSNNNATSGPSKQEQQVFDDKDVIANIMIDSYHKFNDGDSFLLLNFRYDQSLGIPFNLTDLGTTYIGKIYLTNSAYLLSASKSFIGEVSVESNGPTSGVTFTSIIVKDLPPDITTVWTGSIELLLSDSVLVFNALRTTGSNLVIEWSTGTKRTLVFDNAHAI